MDLAVVAIWTAAQFLPPDALPCSNLVDPDAALPRMSAAVPVPGRAPAVLAAPQDFVRTALANRGIERREALGHDPAQPLEHLRETAHYLMVHYVA